MDTNLRCAETVELNTHTRRKWEQVKRENLKAVDCICVKSWSQYPVVLQNITVAEKNWMNGIEYLYNFLQMCVNV